MADLHTVSGLILIAGALFWVVAEGSCAFATVSAALGIIHLIAAYRRA